MGRTLQCGCYLFQYYDNDSLEIKMCQLHENAQKLCDFVIDADEVPTIDAHILAFDVAVKLAREIDGKMNNNVLVEKH